MKNVDKEEEEYHNLGIEGIVKYNKLSPEELTNKLELAKNGDDKAFNDILSSMHIFLIKLKDKFFIQGSDYEDIYQEGAIKLMNVIEKFDANKGNFMTFAQQAIEKHIITCINREKAQKRMHLNNALSLNVEMNSNDSDEKMTFLDNISDDRNLENYNPIEIVQKDYELYIIEEISKELSEMEAKVFYLRFMEHYSYKDIAIELGFFKKGKAKASPDQKSIDNAIMRSRPKIKKVLEKLGLSPKDILNPPKKKKDNSLRQKIEKGIKEIQERSQPESPRELTRRKATESKKIADSKKTIEPKKRKK